MNPGQKAKELRVRLIDALWPMFLVFFLACSPSRPSSPTLATINGAAVSLDAFEKFFQAEGWKFSKKEEALDPFLREQLLLQEAEQRKITVTEAEVGKNLAQIKGHFNNNENFEKVLASKGISVAALRERRRREMTAKKLVDQVVQEHIQIQEEELKSYYQTHANEFKFSEQVHARQIVTDSKEKAVALQEMLAKGVSFEGLALKYSLSPDRKGGGDLGWFERGVMPKEFDQVCFYLETGAWSPVVSTPYGFHLFQVLGKRPGGIKSFDEAKEDIAKQLRDRKGREVFQKWFEELKNKAEVKINEDILSKVF